MGAPRLQNQVDDLSQMWPGYVYFISGRGTEKAQIRIVVKNRRINRVVIDSKTNEARDVYASKPGWEPITTDDQLAAAVKDCEEMGRLFQDRRAAERAKNLHNDGAARATGQAVAAAVREVLQAAQPPTPPAEDDGRGRRRSA